MCEDRDAQKRRAERLREEIERLKRGDKESGERPQSPRDFVEERMREIDEEPAKPDDANS